MSAELQNEATEIITSAIEKSTKEDIIDMEAAARLIKDQLDRSQGPYWHCIMGQGFSSDIMSQKNNLLFMYFSGTLAVLLWKC